MSSSSPFVRSVRGLCAVLGACLFLACGDDDAAPSDSTPDASAPDASAADSSTPDSGSTDSGAADSGTPSEKPLYAVMYEVFKDEGSDSYLSVFDSLDLEELDTGAAREFAGGRAFLRAYEGMIFVGEPGAPIVRRLKIGDDDKLVDDGEISFANFGRSEAVIDDWTLVFISPTKAYLFDQLEGAVVIWNPTTLEIEGEIDSPEGYIKTGYDTGGSPGVVRDSRLYRVISWQHKDNLNYLPEKQLLVYDTERDELIEQVEETRCLDPGNRAFTAEDGTIYFSNWIWTVSQTLQHDAAKNCILRVNPDEDSFDPEWSLEFAELSEGREGAMFTYVGDGRGIASIFHDENVEYDDKTDPYELASNQEWETWSIDIAARNGKPLEGIPRNTGAYTPITLDGRLFLMVPGTGWDNTQVYEVEDNSATTKVNIPGWSYMFVKLR